jgi:transposase InsO family protein
MFLDAYSRLIMGWAICTYPSAASVLAALGKAIRLDPEHGPFGSVPLTLRPDNGLEFAAGSLAKAPVCLAAPWPRHPPTAHI